MVDAKKPRIALRGLLREHFERNPGQQVFGTELVELYKVDLKRLQNCIAGMLRDIPDYPLEPTIPGRAWTYRPAAVSKAGAGRRVFEELAQTKAGDLIIQDEAGNLYRAKELE